MSLQVDYYKKNQINPVDLSQANEEKFNKHQGLRKKLFLEILNIPFETIQDKTIIEFGPNGGENSLIFAKAGYKLFFKEPNILSHENINRLYKKYGLLNSINIEEIYLDYPKKNAQKASIVLAEGFLNSCPDIKESISQLCCFSNEYVIFSYHDKIGTFFDNLKSALLRLLVSISKEESTKVAKDLFLDSFSKLNSARTFESWVSDTLLNPILQEMDLNSLDELDHQFKKFGFNIWSTSPKFNHSVYPIWYKNYNFDFISNYEKSITYILGPEVVTLLTHAKKIMEELSIVLLSPINDDWFLNIEKKILELSKLSALRDDKFTQTIIVLLKSFIRKDTDKIKKVYFSNKNLNLWGMSNIIVALRKDFNA